MQLLCAVDAEAGWLQRNMDWATISVCRRAAWVVAMQSACQRAHCDSLRGAQVQRQAADVWKLLVRV